MSLREEVSGKKQTNNRQSILKLQQLQNLVVWAAAEASIPSSLAALYGRRFAATAEALGLPPDSSLFPCQRCETILQPGFNCTIRIVKHRSKKNQRQKKVISDQQNNVAYNCHFCSYENAKRGTSKGYMKDICPPKHKQPCNPKSEQNKFVVPNKLETEKTREVASPSTTSTKETCSVTGNLSAPPVVKCLTLLDSKKRKRNKPKPKKNDEAEANSAMAGTATAKRKRKGWTTFREEKAKTFTNLSIPFYL